jgi:hypothetical protein
MVFANILMHWVAQLVFERPVKKLSIAVLTSQLDQSGSKLSEHLKTCTDTQGNRNQLRHLIGIERWGQRRLRVAIGEPFLAEEYDHYCPSSERSWEELKADWDNTRQVTLVITKDFQDGYTQKIEHNQYGPLSVKAWLRYLDVHASSEGRRIK